MDNWLPAHRKADGVNGPYVMGYHTRADIPFQFALAEAFTICDAYHCSVMGPTWPNRMYWMTGTIDPDGQAGGPMIKQQADPRRIYAGRPTPSGWRRRASVGRFISRRTTTAATCWSISKSFQNAPPGFAAAHQGHVARAREGQFEHDAMNDKLPAVSWIIPTGTQSEHPDFMPAAGAAFVASKIDAIAANPEVWAKTVFILNYDENDGIFDHVAPPVPPPGTAHEFVDGLPIGGGFPRSVHHRFAVDGGRVGLQPAVRPHFGAAISGEIHRRSGAEHQRLAAANLRRSDFGLSF